MTHSLLVLILFFVFFLFFFFWLSPSFLGNPPGFSCLSFPSIFYRVNCHACTVFNLFILWYLYKRGTRTRCAGDHLGIYVTLIDMSNLILTFYIVARNQNQKCHGHCYVSISITWPRHHILIRAFAPRTQISN